MDISNSTHPKFSYNDSDLTVCSSDNVLFCVHKTNLADHSAVFQDMLHIGRGIGNTSAIPIPRASVTDAQNVSSSNTINLTESSETLAVLLAMCYPHREPPVSVETLPATAMLNCYEATVKYEMWVATLALKGFVEPLATKEPVLVAALAYRLRDSKLLARCERAILDLDLLGNANEYATKAGAAWGPLLAFFFRNKEAATAALVDLPSPVFPSACQSASPKSYILGPPKSAYSNGAFGPFGASDGQSSPCMCAKEQHIVRLLKWHELRLALTKRPTAAFPTAELIIFLSAQLSVASSKNCRPSSDAWRGVQTTVLSYKDVLYSFADMP